VVAGLEALQQRAGRGLALGHKLAVAPAPAPRRIGVALDQRGALGHVGGPGAKELPDRRLVERLGGIGSEVRNG
jgi:hypothetical protein